MSDKANKRVPIIERVARLMGMTAFRDSAGRGGLPRFTDQDIAAALGMVKHTHGELAIQALETFYGSTLMHEQCLRRAWDMVSGRREHAEIALSRLAAALAVRQFAGMSIARDQVLEYAWMAHVRREHLESRMGDVTSWLSTLCGEVEREVVASVRSMGIAA